MSTIDNLNFKLILDDKEFNAKVKAAEEAAQKLNVSLSQLLSIQSSIGKGATKGAQQAADAAEAEARAKQKTAEYAKRLAKTTEEMAKRAENKTAAMELRDQERLNRLVEQGNRKLNERSRIMRELGTVAANVFSIYAAKEVVTNLVRVSAEFEAQRTALGAILGDVAQAQNLFSDIKELAVVSPFSVRDLTAYTKQLSAFSVPYEELFETTKMLADVSAGLGVDMGRIILAYGQVRSAAFLRGTEVRQFTEAGIPILDRLAEMFTEIEGRAVSVGEVFDKISFRQVPFEMVQQAFEDMTSEGGQFYNMQLVLSETLQGQLSNLRDAYEIMFSEIGEKTDGVLKGAVGLARSLAENYENVGKTILQLISIYGAYKVAVAAIHAFNSVKYWTQLAAAVKKTIPLFAGLKLAITETAVAQKVLNLLAKVNPYAAVFSALALVVGLVWRYHDSLAGLSKMQQSVKKSIAGLNTEMTEEMSKYDELVGRLKNATEGTEEYNNAKEAISAAYPNYIANLKEEGVEIAKNAAFYKGLRDEIANTTKERLKATAMTDLDESRSKQLENQQKKFEKYIEQLLPSGQEKAALESFIYGVMDRSRFAEIEGLERFAFMAYDDSSPVFKFLDKIREKIKSINEEYSAGIEAINKNFETPPDDFIGPMPDTRQRWLRTAQEILGSKDVFRSIWPDEYTQYYDFLDNLRKRYSELTEQAELAGNAQKDMIPVLEREKAVIEELANAYDIGTGNTNIFDYVTGKSDNSGRSKNNQTEALRKQIEDLLKLKEAYEELSEAMIAAGKTPVPENILARLKETYGGSMDESAFVDTEFLERVLVLIEKLREYDADAADSFLQRLGEDDWSKYVKHYEDLAAAIEKAKKAQQDFEKYMKSWTSEAELSGSGPSFEISKIISDYTKALEQAQSKMDEAYDKLAQRSAANSAAGKSVPLWSFLLDTEQIKTNYGKDIGNALAEAQEDIRKGAAGWVEAWGPLAAFDLDDWGQKTISELNAIMAAVRNFDMSSIPEEEIEKLKKISGGVDAAGEGIQAFLDSVMEKAEQAKRQAIYDAFHEIASGVSDFAGSVKEFADASGNDTLSSTMEGLQGVLGIADATMKGFMEGGVAGAIVAGVTGLVQEFIEAATAAAKLEASIADAAEEARILRMQMRLDEGVESIFGEDELMRLRNAKDVLDQLRDSVANDRNGANKQIEWKSGLFGWGRSSKTLSDAVRELGYDLYDEYGNLSADGLQAILDTYEDLTSADREWIESAISNSQMYEEAMLQIRDTLSGMFGQLASDLTSGMMEAYEETGSVVDGIDSAFSNLGRNIAEYLTQSILINDVLKKYEDDILKIADAYGGGSMGYSDMIESMGGLSDEMKTEVTAMADVFNALYEQLDEEFGGVFGEGDGSLSSSIKEANLTEETGSLIASYINAIRADVSFSKSQRAQLVDMAGQILNSMMPAPKLDEYLQAIQANTLNAANAARDILSELRGVITTEGGASGVRTYM